jgi:aminoglycoside phosphotransferase (APT) family kinase protein
MNSPDYPAEARWHRAEPRRTWPVADLERMVHRAFPGSRAVDVQPLSGGMRNANFKLRLDRFPEAITLRLFEHDASLCQKEIDVMRLVAGLVPVPEVLYGEPNGFDEFPPFLVARYVEGVTLQELKRGGDRNAIVEAAHSAGETLAAIGRITFPKPGWLGPGPAVTAPLLEGTNVAPRFVDLCLASPALERRIPQHLRERASRLVWSRAAEPAVLENESRLVHCDFGKRNLVMRTVDGCWSVAAVLDWEFAVSDSPLIDLGHFLRYERRSSPLAEPHFSKGFLEGGGSLPEDWLRLGRLLDLTALLEALTRDYLTEEIVAELVELVRATVEDRDPHFQH